MLCRGRWRKLPVNGTENSEIENVCSENLCDCGGFGLWCLLFSRVCACFSFVCSYHTRVVLCRPICFSKTSRCCLWSFLVVPISSSRSVRVVITDFFSCLPCFRQSIHRRTVQQSEILDIIDLSGTHMIHEILSTHHQQQKCIQLRPSMRGEMSTEFYDFCDRGCTTGPCEAKSRRRLHAFAWNS